MHPMPRRATGFVPLAFLLLAAACLVSGLAAASPPARGPDEAGVLRSALLQARDGRWLRVEARAPAAEQAEIRAHFAAVAAYLVAATPRSLDSAVDRFGLYVGRPLSAAERAALRARLAERRALQLTRLADYARAGLFPLNRHYPEARPIFVDAAGTHCAVGHLMALDGRELQVNAIARARPNVLVMEVRDGPLVEWVLTSGLLQEEAALIQPAYFPPATGATLRLSDLVVPGAFISRNGFRYENFTFSATGTGGAAAPAASQLGVVYGWPPTAVVPAFCSDFSATCVTSPDTLWFGVFSTSPGATTVSGSITVGSGQGVSFEIGYDVVPDETGLEIGGAKTFTNGLYGSIGAGSGGVATLSTTLDAGTLGTLDFDFSNLATPGSQAVSFAAPVAGMNVRHQVVLAGPNAIFQAFSSGIQDQSPGPVAQYDGPVTVTAGVATTIPVGANDLGFSGPVSLAVTTPPALGAITAISPSAPAKDMTVTYLAPPGAGGPDDFAYEVLDGTPAGDRATVSVVILPDTDGDGVADAADNCTLVPNPGQCNSDGDAYGNHCDGDFNQNGIVNAQDQTLFRPWLGLAVPTGPPYASRDLNCNGNVNAQDSVLLRRMLGSPPGPSGLAP